MNESEIEEQCRKDGITDSVVAFYYIKKFKYQKLKDEEGN